MSHQKGQKFCLPFKLARRTQWASAQPHGADGRGRRDIQVPKGRDRRGQGACFNSHLLPPYLKRARSVGELIPWLYLEGVSTGDYQEALSALLGEQAKGLSANTVSRLKAKWTAEHTDWRTRDPSERRYVSWWADGVYSNARMDDKPCLLVLIGVTEHGHEELVAVEDGYRESEKSRNELLTGLRERGVQVPPKLATGDGALGFWTALEKVYPETRHQRCWVHKTANVLDKLPKAMQPAGQGRPARYLDGPDTQGGPRSL